MQLSVWCSRIRYLLAAAELRPAAPRVVNAARPFVCCVTCTFMHRPRRTQGTQVARPTIIHTGRDSKPRNSMNPDRHLWGGHSGSAKCPVGDQRGPEYP